MDGFFERNEAYRNAPAVGRCPGNRPRLRPRRLPVDRSRPAEGGRCRTDGAGAARGDDRHVDGVGDGARQLDVVAVLRAVGVHTRQEDLTGAERDGLLDPLEAVEARRRAAAVDVDLPLLVARAARVDGVEHVESVERALDEVARCALAI